MESLKSDPNFFSPRWWVLSRGLMYPWVHEYPMIIHDPSRSTTFSEAFPSKFPTKCHRQATLSVADARLLRRKHTRSQNWSENMEAIPTQMASWYHLIPSKLTKLWLLLIQVGLWGGKSVGVSVGVDPPNQVSSQARWKRFLWLAMDMDGFVA